MLEGDSAAMADKIEDASLAFWFIDAAHTYGGCKRDLKAWAPKIGRIGIIAGDDAQHEPVMQAVKECVPTHSVSGPCWLVDKQIRFDDPSHFRQ